MLNFPSLPSWLLATLLPLGVIWGLFWLVLRRERCYGYNRLLLLLAPLLAAGLPLLPPLGLPAWLAPAAAGSALPAVLLPALPASPAAAPVGWPWQSWLLGLYALGVAVGLARLAWQLGQLWRAGRRLPRVAQAGYTLVHTGGQLSTSSFGRTIFWDETAALAPAEARAVLAHELAHVRQGHTYDRLWLELWRIVLWPNPFAYLLLPALRLTHELLADRAAIQAAAGESAAAYPAILARLAVQRLGGPGYFTLLQPFTFSFTLTRLAMLQNQTPVRRWKQWLVLPVLGGLLFTACRMAEVRPVPASGTAQITPVLDEAAHQADRQDIRRKAQAAQHADSLRTGGVFEPGTTQLTTITKGDNYQPGDAVVTVTRVKAPPLPTEPPVTSSGARIYAYVEQMPQLPTGGGQAAIVAAIQANMVYPVGSDGKPLPEGRAFASFVVGTDGAVQDPKILKSAGPAYDAALLAAISKLPRFVPGQQDGQPVAVSFAVPMLFRPQP